MALRPWNIWGKDVVGLGALSAQGLFGMGTLNITQIDNGGMAYTISERRWGVPLRAIGVTV